MKFKTLHIFIIFILSIILITPDHLYAKKEKKSGSKEQKIEGNFSPSAGQETTKPVFGLFSPVVDITAVPGQQIVTKVTIDNPSTKNATFELTKIALESTQGSSLTSKPIDVLPPDHIGRNFTIESEHIELPARSRRDVTVTINVPANIQGSNYVGVKVVSIITNNIDVSRPEEFQKEYGVGFQPGMISTIKIHIQNTLVYKYQLEEIQIQIKSGNEPPNIYAIVKNIGNAELYINPILILLDDKSNKLITRIKSYRTTTVYPGGTTEIPFQQPFVKINPGTYKGIFTVSKYNLPPAEITVTAKK